jgi:3-keto-5-aminohexanoate cleavage enzyme
MGPRDFPVNTLEMMLVYHVRTGLEDNIYYRRGELARSNAPLVERVVRIANELNMEIAALSEARQILGISAHQRKY